MEYDRSENFLLIIDQMDFRSVLLINEQMICKDNIPFNLKGVSLYLIEFKFFFKFFN